MKERNKFQIIFKYNEGYVEEKHQNFCLFNHFLFYLIRRCLNESARLYINIKFILNVKQHIHINKELSLNFIKKLYKFNKNYFV